MIEYFAPGEVLEASREDELYPETAALLRKLAMQVPTLRFASCAVKRRECLARSTSSSMRGMAPLTLGIWWNSSPGTPCDRYQSSVSRADSGSCAA